MPRPNFHSNPLIAPAETVQAPDWVPPELAPLFERVMQELPAFPDRKTAANV